MESSSVTYLTMNWQIPQSYSEAYKLSSLCFLSMASYLTDPACLMDQYLTSLAAVDSLPPLPFYKDPIDNTATFIRSWTSIDLEGYTNYSAKLVNKVFLATGLIPAILLSPLGIGGILCRKAALWMDPEPLTVLKGDLAPQELPLNNEFTVCTENDCGIEGGFALKEGGVIPIAEWPLFVDWPNSDNRLEAIVQNIRQRRPDVLCLNEIFNVNHALYIAHRLKDLYANFVFGCGSKATGPSSGLFVATKFDIKQATFQRFSREQLYGSAKDCGKGILKIDLKDDQGDIASIYALHLNHSEEPGRSEKEPGARAARKVEMEAVLEIIESSGDCNAIVLGDLNMDDAEMQDHGLLDRFTKNAEPYKDELGETEYTWGGDEWYVAFSNKEPSLVDTALRNAGLKQTVQRETSLGVNLDHVMVYNRENPENTPKVLDTHLEKTGYNPKQITREGRADHRPVTATIKIQRN